MKNPVPAATWPRVGLALAFLVAVAGTTAMGRGAQPAQSPSDQQPAPRFRTEANFVRVDVYPTADGQAVRDLTRDDFEVYEDGKPQKIESFEHVDVRSAASEDSRYEPNTPAEARRIAEQGKGRLFVIFLDTYHVDVAGSHRMKRSLVNLLQRVVGPEDMYAVMTPDMSAGDLTFARKTTTIEGYLSKYWFWGQRDRLYPADPVEQEYIACYPAHTPDGAVSGQEPFQGVAQEMIARRQERKVLDALDDLSKYLRGLREERKAVITVTGGWVLFKPNENLTRNGRSTIPRVGVNTDGRLTSDVQAHDWGYSKTLCESDRMMLANLDDFTAFHDLLDDANRGNVTFYPVNALGLVAFDKPLGPGDQADPLEGEVQALGPGAHVNEDPNVPLNPLVFNNAMIRARTDNLISLAENTDGLAVVNTNDVDRGLKRIIDDLTSYYLLGYYSGGKLDGKYRKITVKVKRPGVDVRARRGYRAATEEEVEASRAAAAVHEAQAPASAVQAALNSLGTARAGIPLRTSVSYAATADGEGHATSAHVWALAELDSAVARQGDWLGGGTVEVALTSADGTPLASKTVDLPAGQRSVTADLGAITPPAGELLVRTHVRPQQDRGLPYTDTIHVGTLATPGRPLVLRRGPTTGIQYVATADLQFRRTERIRVDLPITTAVTSTSGEVLDRTGAPMTVPVRTTTRTEGGLTWVSADVTLAPFAPGDYLIRLKADAGGASQEVLAGFRIVP